MSDADAGPVLGDLAEVAALNQLLSQSGLAPLDPAVLAAFKLYLDLILRWNARTNLTAIRDADGILRRHFVESISCAQALPAGIKTLLDFGSGAGLPGIPIAICRPEIAVTLAESQNKKAAFLREAVSVLGLKSRVFGGRAESLTVAFDCVAMRAVDRMERAIVEGAALVRPGGFLALLTTTGEFSKVVSGLAGFLWKGPVSLAGSNQRVLCLGAKAE